MIINSPEVKKVVEDYDFTFISGQVMPITVSPSEGDTISIGPRVITVFLTSKPSQTNPDKMLPAEDITIFVQHLISMQHREREVTQLSPEEQFEWMRVLHKLNDTVQ